MKIIAVIVDEVPEMCSVCDNLGMPHPCSICTITSSDEILALMFGKRGKNCPLMTAEQYEEQK